MKDFLLKFLGGSPLRVLIKLLIISIIFGAFFTLIGLTPSNIAWGFYYFLHFIWNCILSVWYMGFDAFGVVFNIILAGAIFVLPIFILIRLLNYKK